MVNEVIFRDARTGLTVDIFPVEDEAQRDVLEQAERITLHEAKRIRVIQPEGLALMLLREVTSGDQERRSERLRDIEVLARKNELDWAYLRRWVKQMGYEDAYRELRIEEKPTL